MLSSVYSLWLESLPLHASGYITAFIVASLVTPLCFVKLRVKTWNVFFMSLAVAFCCFVSLLAFAIIGIVVVSTGILGMARGWASFGDSYIWGVFSLPLLAFFVSLGGFALTHHSRGSR